MVTAIDMNEMEVQEHTIVATSVDVEPIIEEERSDVTVKHIIEEVLEAVDQDRENQAVLRELRKTRSQNEINKLVSRMLGDREINDELQRAIELRRAWVRKLFRLTHGVAKSWARYGNAQDLFPGPLFGNEAVYMKPVQAGRILVLDKDIRRLMCYESENGLDWSCRIIYRKSKFRVDPKCLLKIRKD